LANAEDFQKAYENLSEEDKKFLFFRIGNKAAKLQPEQLITYLFNNSNQPNFGDAIFDGTLRSISAENIDIYSVSSATGLKIKCLMTSVFLFRDASQRDAFCRALLNKLVNVSFEKMFTEKYDFFATIFEYLIKDYNSDSGGKYAEYYTPHAVARIMAAILVNEEVKSAKVYDPSAGSGTLLMNIAHAIGEKTAPFIPKIFPRNLPICSD
jgi:type I restriction enzyme M protein